MNRFFKCLIVALAVSGALVQPHAHARDVRDLMSKSPIATTSSASFAIHDGTLMGWGQDGNGYLGTGLPQVPNRPTPTAVAGFGSPSTNPASRIVAISSLYSHALALTASGQVYAWGRNLEGQLGDGTTVDRPVTAPPLLLGLSNIVAVATGRRHSMALDASGRVYVWGANMYGQLGLGHTNPVYTPTLNPNLSNVTVIGTGWDHSLATTASGTSYAWGDNGHAQLGIGVTSGAALVPTPISGGTSFKQFSGGRDFTLALDNSGRAWAFGRDVHGQLGDGPGWTLVFMPVLVSGLGGLDIVSVAAGDQQAMALDSQGRVYAWGRNLNGARGDNDAADHFAPARISAIRDFIVAIAAGPYTSLAADSNGQLFAWGSNSNGQFGTGATGAPTSTPTKSLYAFTYKVLVLMLSIADANYAGLQIEMGRLAEDIARYSYGKVKLAFDYALYHASAAAIGCQGNSNDAELVKNYLYQRAYTAGIDLARYGHLIVQRSSDYGTSCGTTSNNGGQPFIVVPGGPNYNGLGIGVAYLSPSPFNSSSYNRNVIAHEFTHGYGRAIAGVTHPMGVDCYLPSGAAYAPGLRPGFDCPWYDLLTPMDLMAQSTNIPNNWSGPGAVNEGTFHKDLWRWLNPEGDIALHTLPSLSPGAPTTLRATFTLSPSDSANLIAGNTYALKIPVPGSTTGQVYMVEYRKEAINAYQPGMTPRHTLQAGVYLYLGVPNPGRIPMSHPLRSAQKDSPSTIQGAFAHTVAPLPVGQTYLVQDGFGLRVTSITATSATVEVLIH